MRRRQLQFIILCLVAAATWFGAGAQASSTDRAAILKTAKVGGKWRIAWNVRLGTVRGILLLKQSAAHVTGMFQEYGHTYPLSGSIQGRSITFVVPFTGPRPYTIEFKGTIDGDNDSIRGTSRLADGGQAFLGHAGEVDDPERTWTATKGLKRQNNTPDKPPDNDDDDDRGRDPRIGQRGSGSVSPPH